MRLEGPINEGAPKQELSVPIRADQHQAWFRKEYQPRLSRLQSEVGVHPAQLAEVVRQYLFTDSGNVSFARFVEGNLRAHVEVSGSKPIGDALFDFFDDIGVEKPEWLITYCDYPDN